ncbi:MAG: peptidase dimerization domain-containing protein, partial [Planctomycetaceae bacterium]
GSLNDITIEEKGVLHLEIRCAGHAAHAARPWLGENALQKLLRHLEDLDRHFGKYASDADQISEQHWIPTCALTVVRTPNQSANRIPAEALAVVDIRFPPTHTVTEMLSEAAVTLGPDCQLTSLMQAEPTFLDPDEIFCQVTEEISGSPARLIRSSGGSDGRFLRQFGIPVNLSRPLVGNLHGPDEWIDVASMATYYRICETYIQRKLGLSGPGCE